MISWIIISSIIFFKHIFMYLPCPDWGHYWKRADTQFPLQAIPSFGKCLWPRVLYLTQDLNLIPIILGWTSSTYTGTIDETWRVQGLGQTWTREYISQVWTNSIPLVPKQVWNFDHTWDNTPWFRIWPNNPCTFHVKSTSLHYNWPSRLLINQAWFISDIRPTLVPSMVWMKCPNVQNNVFCLFLHGFPQYCASVCVCLSLQLFNVHNFYNTWTGFLILQTV